MLEKLHFIPQVDLPLAVITLVCFILHFNHWAKNQSSDIDVDLSLRLPVARFRVVVLIASLVLFCWLINAAFWSVFALLFALGLALSVVSGGRDPTGTTILLVSACAVREWAFGFPQLILHPPQTDEEDTKDSPPLSDVIGMRGTTTSPLRPYGEADFSGQPMPVMSNNGELVDAGTKVIVTRRHQGVLCVRPMIAP